MYFFKKKTLKSYYYHKELVSIKQISTLNFFLSRNYWYQMIILNHSYHNN